MGVNLGIEYLHASAVIKPPIGLPNKARFVKFEKNLLFLISVLALRSALAKHGAPW